MFNSRKDGQQTNHALKLQYAGKDEWHVLINKQENLIRAHM